MNALLTKISEKANGLVAQGELVLQTWEELGWRDDRPDREEARTESRLASLLVDYDDVDVPASARISDELRERYDNWYSGCLGLVSANMNVRIPELIEAHRTANEVLSKDYFTFDDQLKMARSIKRINAIVYSTPQFLNARLHDMELALAEAYVGDELNEASALVKAGYVRCAGAMAGVLVERHLKVICEHQQPPLKYGKHDGITKLNDKLRDAQVYDQAQWRQIQWMGDIRNACDHPGSSEPKKEDVTALIDGVRKFIALT